MKRLYLSTLALGLVCCDTGDIAPQPDDSDAVEQRPIALEEEPEPSAEQESRKLAIKGPTDSESLELKKARDMEISTQRTETKPIGDLKANAKNSGTLGALGVGRGGGGISSHGIGLANVGTAGRGGGGRGGSGYGKGIGNLGSRKAAPRIRTGSATVRGGKRGIDDMRDQIARGASTSGEDYKHHGTNKFTDASEDRLSTFAVDVDTGSYTIARRKLNHGGLPPAASVRVEEFVNYFSYNYPKPESGAFRVSMEGAPSPFATDGKRQLLRIGVQGKAIAEEDRKPVHLTFLVDVSGSMRRADKIGLVKHSLGVVARNLRPNDTVAIATYAGRTEVVLEPTNAAKSAKIMRAIEGLGAGGSTAMSSGLELAYGLAEKNLRKGEENRVIVLSDGDANVGRTNWNSMLGQIRGQVKKGVTLSTIGFGMGNYKDTLMEQLANNGNGNYYYVDTEREAERIFGDQLDGTLQVIAKDVKIQVDFNPEAVRRYRLVGYENRDIADKDFRNDKVDAGEIGAGHTVTALYELELYDELPERVATVRVRHKEPHGSDKAAEQSFAFDRDDLHDSIADSSRDFQFAAAVCAFAEKLRKAPYARELTYDWILEVARGSTGSYGDRKEFVKLVENARKHG